MIDKNALLRLKDVQKLIPLCKASIYNLVKDGILPMPLKMGKASFWKYDDIVDVINSLERGILSTTNNPTKKDICVKGLISIVEISDKTSESQSRIKYILSRLKQSGTKKDGLIYYRPECESIINGVIFLCERMSLNQAIAHYLRTMK